jgi:hypothetical protein
MEALHRKQVGDDETQVKRVGRPNSGLNTLIGILSQSPADLEIGKDTRPIIQQAVQTIVKSLNATDAVGNPTPTASNVALKIVAHMYGEPSSRQQNEGQVSITLVYPDGRPANCDHRD